MGAWKGDREFGEDGFTGGGASQSVDGCIYMVNLPFRSIHMELPVVY